MNDYKNLSWISEEKIVVEIRVPQNILFFRPQFNQQLRRLFDY